MSDDTNTVESEVSGASAASADLLRTAADPSLTEDLALALLKRSDLTPEILERVAKNGAALKSRKVKIALVSHPHTPRHVSIPVARQFYTFDLMKVALSAAIAGDIRVAVDDILISRLKTITAGERLTLARRASGRVAAALLLGVGADDGKSAVVERQVSDREMSVGKLNSEERALETRVMKTALENPRLTEALVISSVLHPHAGVDIVEAVAKHPKWSKRREIRATLLRTAHLALAKGLEFSREIPAALLEELLATSHLPARIKNQLLRESNKSFAEVRHNLATRTPRASRE
jgi:hypothetical protein